MARRRGLLFVLFMIEFSADNDANQLVGSSLRAIVMMVERKALVSGVVVLTCITSLMAIYALFLNKLFYSQYAPFFDSSSYLLHLHSVFQQAHNQGFLQGLDHALDKTTVALPFLEVALLALFIDSPSRELSPLIQLPWLTMLSVSIFIYFLYFRHKGFVLSLVLTLPFLCISAVWRYNGGLSDFRMDLFHYLLIGTAFVWFLSTRYTKSYWPWVLVGLFSGLTFLTRATSPIYLGFCILPLLFLRLIIANKKAARSIALKALISLLIAVIISGWFYVRNYEHLHYYYVLWNVDANAKLPISQSLLHARFARWNIGIYSLSVGLASFFLTIFTFCRRGLFLSVKNVLSQVNWEALWLGMGPILLLILRGAGHNPFVVMPASFGILMFLLDPISEEELSSKTQFSQNASMLLAIFSSFLFLFASFQGYYNHLNPHVNNIKALPELFPNMEPQKQLLEMIIQDSSQLASGGTISIDTTYISNLNTVSLQNILNFDILSSIQNSQNYKQASQISFPYVFNGISSPYNWSILPGKTDEDKIAYLVKEANKNLNYVILPDDKSLQYIEPLAPYVIVNRHNSEIKRRLLESNNWEQVGDVVQVDHLEFVKIYRNQQYLGKAS